MGTLLERNEARLARIQSPGPLADRVREVLERGKREQLLAGLDAQGDAFAPLAPSTLRKPRPNPTPLVPQGAASRLVTDYTVEVTAEPGRLHVSAGWPGHPEVQYLRSGTRRMPARDPGGFRDRDRREILTELSEFVRGPDR